jgi:glycosyltransferase involved in cell wall biosynthesis
MLSLLAVLLNVVHLPWQGGLAMKTSVIVTTYNSPHWLEKVVWGYSVQTFSDFELVIADDGSDGETGLLLSRLAAVTGLSIRHIWHEDRGFRKCRILNEAIKQSMGDRLVFTDGDCIPRRDFLEVHDDLAEQGCFLSGGLVRLPLALSERISIDDIVYGRATDRRWLRSNGLPMTRKVLLLNERPRWGRWLDGITTTRPSWNGHNSSGWREDILRVNGFDERMAYGGLDRELGERLVNAGVRPKQVRHRAVCIHLDHDRSYINQEAWQRNLTIRREVRKRQLSWTEHGIYKGPRGASGVESAFEANQRRA